MNFRRDTRTVVSIIAVRDINMHSGLLCCTYYPKRYSTILLIYYNRFYLLDLGYLLDLDIALGNFTTADICDRVFAIFL